MWCGKMVSLRHTDTDECNSIARTDPERAQEGPEGLEGFPSVHPSILDAQYPYLARSLRHG